MIVLILNYLLKNAIYSSYYNFVTFILLNLLVLNLIICVSSLNLIHSILFLILSFFCLSSIFFLLNLRFIGILIILIYGGAISILLLFVLMILDIKFFLFEMRLSYRYFIFYFLFFVLTLFILIIFSNKSLVYAPIYIHIDYMKVLFMQDELVVLGDMLYNRNFFSLLMVGIILFVALIGSVSMVLNNRNKKKISMFNQLNIDKKKMCFNNSKKKLKNELQL